MKAQISVDELEAVVPVEHPMALLEASESLDAKVHYVLEMP